MKIRCSSSSLKDSILGVSGRVSSLPIVIGLYKWSRTRSTKCVMGPEGTLDRGTGGDLLSGDRKEKEE